MTRRRATLARVAGVCGGLAVVLCIAVWPSATALAKKGGGGGGKTQDIALKVTADDLGNPGVSSDLGGAYTDSKKNHVQALIGGGAGKFVMDTNTNTSPTGRTMWFVFGAPAIALAGYDAAANGDPPHLLSFDGSTVNMPVGVRIDTARSTVGEENGYVNLGAMAIGESADVAMKFVLIVTDLQNHYRLHYRDTWWPPHNDAHDPNMDSASFLRVTRQADDGDGKRVWTIESVDENGHWAYLTRIVDNQYVNSIPVGIFYMPLKLTLTEK